VIENTNEKKKSELIIEILEAKNEETLRNELIQCLNINPKVFDRYINPLLESGEITKRKDGKDIWYILSKPLPVIMEEEAPPSPLKSEVPYTKEPETLHKYDLKKRIKEIVHEKGEISRQNLMKELKSTGKNISRTIAPLINSGEIIRIPKNNEIYYVDPGTELGPELIKLNATDILIKQIRELDSFLEHRRTECGSTDVSVKTYAYKLTNFYRWLSNPTNPKSLKFSPHAIATITKTQIREYLKHCKEVLNHEAKTEAGTIAHLKSYFGYCKEEGWIVTDPMEGIKTPRVPKKKKVDITYEDFQKIVEIAPNFRDKVILQLFFWTGARVSEVYKCDLSDINWDAQEITLHGKFSKDRTINFAEPLIEPLRTYIEQYRGQSLDPTEKAVFLNSLKTRLSIRGLKKLVLKARGFAKITTKVTCHSFRRGCGRMLHEMGMDILEIKEQFGHESVATTQEYINVPQERTVQESRKAIAKRMGGSPNDIASQQSELENLVLPSIGSPHSEN
jgi:site-specific recombinase XerD/predicted transcriptional regulator